MVESRWRILRYDDIYWLKAGYVNIALYRGLEDEGWLLTCEELGYDARPMNTGDGAQARRLAVQLVRVRMKEALDMLDKEIG